MVLLIFIRIILGLVIIETFLSFVIKLSKTFSEAGILTSILFILTFFPICYFIGCLVK
jgi:hypothetical protein